MMFDQERPTDGQLGVDNDHEAYIDALDAAETTPDPTPPAFDRAAFEKRRDEAIERGERWLLPVSELFEAYEAGVRNFYRADLRAADLRDANLSAANLSAANLSAANLSAADLRAANLRAADLRAANLSAADLRAANLRAADLRAANLSDANLSDVYADFLHKCMIRPHELGGLRLALVEGRVNGSSYEGTCACFVGTIANVAKCAYTDLGITPNSSSPVEQFFMHITTGDTPETSAVSALVVGWLDELIAFGKAYQSTALVVSK